MSSDTILLIAFPAFIVLAIIIGSAKSSGYQAAQAKYEQEYGTIVEYQKAAIQKINDERNAFENSQAEIFENMRQEAKRIAWEEEKENIRKLKIFVDNELQVKKRDFDLKLDSIKKDIKSATTLHQEVFSTIEEFQKGILLGRKWLAQYASELTIARHELSAAQRRRAPKTTEMHQKLKQEHKSLFGY